MAKITEIQKIMAGSDLFRSVTPEAQARISLLFKKINAHKGNTIIREGDTGEDLYLVFSGSYNVTRRTSQGVQKIGQIRAGSVFGEAALLNRAPRNAGVVCDTPGILLALSYDDFQTLLRKHPADLRPLIALISKRARRVNRGIFRPDPQTIKKFLADVPLFKGLSAQVLSKLEAKMEWFFLPGGEYLMRQGDSGDAMYVVVNGTLRYEVIGHNSEIITAGNFYPGDVIGEISLLTGEYRSASVYSVISCELVRIDAATFNSIFLKYPEAMVSVSRVIAHRLTGDRLARRHRQIVSQTITLFPGGEQRGNSEFPRSLKKVLNRFGQARLVEYQDFIQNRGSVNNYDTQDLVHWLFEQQQSCDILLVVCDFDAELWTEAAVHHANRIILYACASGNPELSGKEIRYLGESDGLHLAPIDLVLLHEKESIVQVGSGRWLAYRKADSCFHIYGSSQTDYLRLARRLTGNSIGLALGGGGAKGFAHIGLLKAFHEGGIHIDMIGGTSAGALMASIYAMGYDIREMEIIAKKLMSDQKTLNDYTLPGVSLIRGRKFNRVLQEFYGEVEIEDLRIPFFSVATSLTKAEKRVFDRGPLWKALRASASIPGILPPMYDNGEVLVDGAMLDNIPGSVMRSKGADFVISAGLASETDSRHDAIYETLYAPDDPGALPSIRSIIWKKFKKSNFGKQEPGMLDVLMRSTFVASDAAVAQVKADSDIFIPLPVEMYGLFDWKKYSEIVATGYEYGKANISRWKKELGLK